MKKYLIMIFLGLITFIGLGFSQFTLPASTLMNTPVAEFSTDLAFKHLEVIAKAPHPIGSSQNTEVRNYIVEELIAQGLTPQIQTATVVNPKWGTPIVAGTVHNVVAKLEGTQSTKAVLLMAHYDSVPNGAGASDDGVGVAAMLETLRVLKSEPPLKNDVIFLFSDGEEPGLLGAKAFADEHPWDKEVGVVLNFEARGTHGSSILFETSSQNGRLIREFAKAVPHPVASSLFYSIYTLLPNDTDLTIFKEAGFPGMNFAFIDGLISYHTQRDNLANVSSHSLQHHGENMLALTRRLGNIDLNQIQETDAVYFNFISPIFIQYSQQWVIPLSVLVTLLFAGIIRVGLRRKHLTFKGIGIGFGVVGLNMTLAAFAVTLAWWLISQIHTEYQWIPQGDTYNSSLYLIAFVALSIAIASASYSYAQQKTTIPNLMAGAMLWWLILTILTSLFLPGASYLFTWPLLFSLIGLGFLLSKRFQKLGLARRLAVLSICALPGIILFSGVIYPIFLAITVSLSGAIAILVVLLLGLLIPHLALMAKEKGFQASPFKAEPACTSSIPNPKSQIPNRPSIPGSWFLPRLALGLSFIALLAGSFTAGFDANHPKPNSIFYGLNADTRTAIWASADREPDEWTSQFLSTTPKKAKLTDYFPMVSREFLQSQAPTIALTPPQIEILSDKVQKGLRTLNLQVTSPRQARVLYLSADSDIEILAASVNGKKIDRAKEHGIQRQEWGLNYFALPLEGIKLTLAVKPSQKFKLKVTDRSDGLPGITGKAFKPRPNYTMSTAFGGGVSDSTLASTSFTF
jgi:hypothetical protein